MMVGKWHLGDADRKYWPQNRGFDYLRNVVGEVEYFTRERGGVIDWQRNGVFLKEDGYYTDLIGNDAVKLIDQQDGKQPFFLYFASLPPHAPYQSPQSAIDQYSAVVDPLRRTYSAMISELDVQVGRVVAELDKKGLRDNTIILFASDNGGATSGLFAQGARATRKGRGRGRHPSRAEAAGVRCAVQRRQGQPQGGRRARARVRQLAGSAQAPRRDGAAAHGRRDADTADVGRRTRAAPTTRSTAATCGRRFGGDTPSPNEDVLINVEAFRGAIRKGDWKLIKIALLPGKTQLFNLFEDPGETTDVAAQHPEIVQDLEARLLAYAKEQKPSLWLMAQPGFLGAQGKTILIRISTSTTAACPARRPSCRRIEGASERECLASRNVRSPL